MKIRHAEWLQLQQENEILYGYSQQWYGTSFRRTRGCGPTAAAMLLLYLNRREGGTLLPVQDNSIPAIAGTMEDIWQFVTPNWLLGLHNTQRFCQGVARFCQRHALDWQCRRLPVAMWRRQRPTLVQVIDFLEQALAADCPIAFLNLHNGQAVQMEAWHWTVLTALQYDATQDAYWATCYDGGRKIVFDVGGWLNTSRLGGGFCYVDPLCCLEQR